MTVSTYEDADCDQEWGRSKRITTVNYKEVLIPSTSTSVETFSKEISYKGLDNTYTFKVKPERVLDPRNEGRIIVSSPFWHVRRYPPLEDSEECTSDCFDVTKMRTSEERVEIDYENMKAECTAADKEIVIVCSNGLNPFYPDTFDGFSISFFDSEDHFI
jgi:hypothetical protein